MSDAAEPAVLIVEDEGVTRLVLRHLAEQAGYRAYVAADGPEALDWLARNPSPRLILLDLALPRLPGTEVLFRISECPRLSQVPVVILSGSTPPSRSWSSPQVQDYLAKPWRPEQIRSLLSAGLQRSGAEGLREAVVSSRCSHISA